MPLGEPFVPTEPEWLIRAQAGLPPIKKTSELPRIIPPLPTGDTKDLKVWREYWKQHDAQIAKAAREQFTFADAIEMFCYIDIYQYFDETRDIEDVSRCQGKECNYCGKFNEDVLRHQQEPQQ